MVALRVVDEKRERERAKNESTIEYTHVNNEAPFTLTRSISTNFWTQ